MEDKTEKKRVQKRAVRKKAKAAEPVPVTASIPVTTETKKPRKTSKTKTTAARPTASKAKLAISSPTFEQVQLRAYFISERRQKLGLPGDESHDWLAAEQELREELKV